MSGKQCQCDQTNSHSDLSKLKDHIGALLFYAVILWLLFAFLPIIARGFPDKAGEVGDSFGMATSLFSSLGFVIAFYTLLKQVELTNKTNQIAVEAKNEEKRRREVDVMIKLKTDLSRIHHFMASLVSSSTAGIDMPGMSGDAAVNRYAEIMIMVESNEIPLRLTFGERAEPVLQALFEYYKGVISCFAAVTQRKPASTDLQLDLIRKIDKLILAICDESAKK
jgi:hypothetical protein